jgi:hypothetical protein
MEPITNHSYRGCRTSALEAVKRCPFSVQKVYRDKLKGYISSAALRGSAVHDALEDYGVHCLRNNCATDFEYWDSIINKYAASVPLEVYKETFDILVNIKEFVNYSMLLDTFVSSIEERFYLDENLNIIDAPKPGEPEAYFSSAIDYYFIEHDQETANVFDYKTSRKIYSPTVMKTKLQKDNYPFLIFQKYPQVKVINFFFEFSRYGVLTEPIIVTRADDWERLRNQLIADINLYHEVINDPNDREARPSGFCQLCEVRGICPSVKNALLSDVIITDEVTALEAARQYKALQLKMKQVKESLEVYLDHGKNIEISKTEGFGIQKTIKESVTDLYHVVKDLESENVAPGKIFDALKLTKAAFLKLIKGTNIPKEKYLVEKPGTKTGFFDLESDEEEEHGEEE